LDLVPRSPLNSGPDACEGGQRPVIVESEPDDILFLGLGVGLGRVFGEAVERDQASVFRLQPASPVRGRGIADIGDRRAAKLRGRRHAPTHHGQLALGTGVAHDRCRVVRKDAWHRRAAPGR
jgi:hypothetical protein